jgi:hypothetical protein
MAKTADEVFAAIVKALGRRGVEKPEATAGSARRFGSSALRVEGRIFAMVSRGQVVLKLPAARVSELIASGTGQSFDAGKGRPMKEWVALSRVTRERAVALAAEALEFVSQVG